jgi:zinc protease
MKRSALEIQRVRVRGATLLLIEDHSLPVVRFVVTHRPGAAADPCGESGLTRVMMDLTMRGTRDKTREAFNAALEEMGSALSAATGMEAAMWRGITLKRYLRSTFALLGEAMATPALSAAELGPLVDEAVESLRADRDDDETVAEIFLRQALYRGHPLSRSPQGEIPELQALTLAAVNEAHRQRIVPTSIVGAMAGDVTLSEARDLLGELVRDLPDRPYAALAPAPPPMPRNLQILLVDKPERTQAQLRVARPAIAGNHPDVLAFWLGVMSFGGTFTSPLTREVRDVRGWSYVAHAAFDRLSGLTAPLVLRSAPAMGDVVDCLALELDLYAGLARGELATDTVEFARSYVVNRYPLEIANASDLVMAALRHELIGEQPDEAFLIPEKIARLEPAEVGLVMRRHLEPTNAVVVIVATAGTVEPALRARFPSADVAVVDFREGLGFKLTP